MAESAQGDDRIYIREASVILNRQIATLRKWETTEALPKKLRPRRGKRRWRYWTPHQIAEIQKWMERTDRRAGVGLSHYKPTEKQLNEAMAKMRRPRKRKDQSAEKQPESV